MKKNAVISGEKNYIKKKKRIKNIFKVMIKTTFGFKVLLSKWKTGPLM